MARLNPFRRHMLVLRLDAASLLEAFLIAAVTSFLTIRFILAVTEYPTLGGGHLHIAHMLWGGLGMMAAIVMLLVSLSRLSAEIAAVLGGAGFGVFIDELGKVISKDSDYFFRPTIAIIYAIFVVLALAFRAIARQRPPSPQTCLANAVELTKEAVIRDLDVNEQRRALALLARCDRQDPLVAALSDALARIEAVQPATPHVVVRVRHWVDAGYRSLVSYTWFTTVVVVGFVTASLVEFGVAIARVEQLAATHRLGSGTLAENTVAFAEVGSLVSSLAVGVLVFAGIVALRDSRLAAYRWFERAALVSIFLGQVFSFYLDQLEALLGLAVSIVILVTLRYTIHEEEDLIAHPGQ